MFTRQVNALVTARTTNCYAWPCSLQCVLVWVRAHVRIVFHAHDRLNGRMGSSQRGGERHIGKRVEMNATDEMTHELVRGSYTEGRRQCVLS